MWTKPGTLFLWHHPFLFLLMEVWAESPHNPEISTFHPTWSSADSVTYFSTLKFANGQ
jgi:hypothetical protein